MQDKFTIDEIKKALKQSEANLNFEEIDVKELTKEKDGKQKMLRKEPKK